jgi:hypothetical protein
VLTDTCIFTRYVSLQEDEPSHHETKRVFIWAQGTGGSTFPAPAQHESRVAHGTVVLPARRDAYVYVLRVPRALGPRVRPVVCVKIVLQRQRTASRHDCTLSEHG